MTHLNGLGRNVHYHNSVPGVINPGKDGIYKPSISIKSDILTDKYTIKADIGRGKFAVVRKCIHNESGEEFAAKFIRKRRRGKSCREEIMREVVMLEKTLEHPRLVDLKEVCSGGELYNECVIEESFKEADVVRMMRQILEGLLYLHERNIVHLDLKPQNILFTKPFPEGDIKLCDLGFACLVNTGEDIRDIIGTPDYVAPEVLSYEPLGLYTDMSLGVLTYVMLTAHSPFAGNTQQETFLNISQVNLDFPESLFSSISSTAQDFIVQLLQKEPRDRLTAKQCFDHPWIAGVSNPSIDLSLQCSQSQEEMTSIQENNDQLANSVNENACDKDTYPLKLLVILTLEILSNQENCDKDISILSNQDIVDKDEEDLMSNQDVCDKNVSFMSNQDVDEKNVSLMSSQDIDEKDEDVMSHQDVAEKEELMSNADEEVMGSNPDIGDKDFNFISNQEVNEELKNSENKESNSKNSMKNVHNFRTSLHIEKLTDSFKENEQGNGLTSADGIVSREIGPFVNDYTGKVYSSHLDIIPNKILRINPECDNFVLDSQKDVIEQEKHLLCSQKGCSNMEMDTISSFLQVNLFDSISAQKHYGIDQEQNF
ncbi:LOW QUALITY PROTEIN: hypothetical protein KUTeg_008468 [Tegillarca granosa]|uniref:Protein kinase domain-containing protein n=1 Tax=Tegillarca granosa TaxID=220873 RepID=A0ABQ9FBX2_TEGGR|nr:LOW QUALITY PROTEIN: hypothetical protein KUTeg_008468 [Tegillarca granosa]